jgi:arabinogalactan endo-1,4-beta-galactosidase
MILGIDASTYFEEAEINAKYYIDGKEVDPLDEFVKNGVRYMRIRIWNNPYDEEGRPYLGGTSDVEKFIELSKICQAKGYKIVPDFHYSDFWADPGKQTMPKAWMGLGVDEVAAKISEFTTEVLSKAKALNIDIPYVQIGNEITNGMCWPIGRLIDGEPGQERTNYENLIKLLKAGIAAAKSVYPEIQTIIHLERSYDQAVYKEYFTKLREANVNYDIIGASYYPYWHGTFDQFFANMNMCKKEFGKPVMAMELGYGFTLEDYIKNNNGIVQLVVNENFDFHQPYPLTPEGQAQFIEEFLRLAKENDLAGVFYWEPTWIPGENICWASKEGQKYIREEGKSTRNEWANQCLFDYSGNKLPSFDKFKL